MTEVDLELEGTRPADRADPDETRPASSTQRRPGILYHDRVLVVGYSSSGKSEILNVLWSGMRCQRLLVDTKDEFSIAGVDRVYSVDELDWSQPILHYVGELGTTAEFDRLFEVCYGRAGVPLSVSVHELADLCEYQANRTPKHVNAYLSKGNAHGLGLLGGSQRPYQMPVRAKSEVQHVIYVVPELQPDDHETVARIMQQSPGVLSDLVNGAQERHGEYAFIWYDRRARDLSIWPALPERLRRTSIVTRRTVAA